MRFRVQGVGFRIEGLSLKLGTHLEKLQEPRYRFEILNQDGDLQPSKYRMRKAGHRYQLPELLQLKVWGFRV